MPKKPKPLPPRASEKERLRHLERKARRLERRLDKLTPKQEPGHPPITDEQLRQMEAFLRLGYTLRSACRGAQIGYSTVRRICQERPSYRAHLRSVRIHSSARLVHRLRELALKGDTKALRWLVEQTAWKEFGHRPDARNAVTALSVQQEAADPEREKIRALTRETIAAMRETEAQPPGENGHSSANVAREKTPTPPPGGGSA